MKVEYSKDIEKINQREKKLSKATMRLIVDLKIATMDARTWWNILDIQKEITINLKVYAQLNF